MNRTLKVVAGVIVTSTVVGALAGVTAAALLAIVLGSRTDLLDPHIYAFTGSVGATCGAILGPAVAFGFLRRVPLGRLFGETGAATVVGALAGSSCCRPVSPSRSAPARWDSPPRRPASRGATADPASQPNCHPPA